MSELPPGFTLDPTPQSNSGLPEGFVLDDPKPGVVRDVAQQTGVGLARGAMGVFGLPGTLKDMLRTGFNSGADAVENFVRQKVGADPIPPEAIAARDAAFAKNRFAVSGADIEADAKKAGLPMPAPATEPGKAAANIAEFIPGAVMGPGSLAGNVLRYGVAPGVAAEGAGRLVEGQPAEPFVRAGAALAAGGVAGAVRRPSAPEALKTAMQGVDDATLTKASQVMQNAQQQGVNLTWAEAIQQATGGGTNLGNLQRVVENAPGGDAVMRPFMAQRPAQMEAAGRQAMDAVSPPIQAPSAVGPAVGEAAKKTISDVTDAINTTTRPAYQAAQVQRIDPQTFAQVSADPVFQQGLQIVRNDRWIGPTLKGLPDDSVQVIDAIKQRLDEIGKNLKNPGSADPSNFAASIVGQGNSRMVQAADAATGSAPGVQGSYEAARTAQAQLREKYLQPLMDGPLGRLMNRPETKQAVEALFPSNPLPGSANEVSTAISALAKRNPKAAQELIRAHAEGTFNEAMQKLASGPNEFGAAKFSAVLQGNPQQAENLRAAVEALPNGTDRWNGFSRFLETAEATGQRQQVGSKTSFNTQAMEQLKGGGKIGEMANLAATGGVKIPARVSKWYEQMRLGKNAEKLAQILIDPDAAPLLRSIAREPATSAKAQAITLRLMAISDRAVSQSARLVNGGGE